jgi:RNA polymerase sigma-70 factor (ECF subfamily)
MVMVARAQWISGVRQKTSETTEHLLMEDDQLINQARAGDETAYEQLVTKYGKRVLSIAARFFRHPDVREDIAQEVFIKVYQSLDMFRPGEPFEPWLTKIALNTCYDHLRQIKRRKELKFSEITEEEAAWLDRQRSEQAMSAFEDEQAREAAARLAEKVLETLAPDDRMALLLFERDGLSTAEIAEILGWSRANVKVRLFRARRALRQTLEHITNVKRET